MSDLPFDISYTFNSDLRDVPTSPDDMARAVEYLQTRIASADSSPRDQARLLGQAGVLCRMLLRLDEAEEHCERAVAICREVKDARCEVAHSLRLAHVYQWQGRFGESDWLFLQMRGWCESDPNVADYLDFVYQHYGKSLFDQGRYAEAAEMFRRALEIREGKGDQELVASTTLALQTAQAKAID